MTNIKDIIDDSCKSVAVAGHANPDGDCIGSCTALYMYLRKNFPEISVSLYLERPKEALCSVKGMSEAEQEVKEGAACDLFICCDTSIPDRIGVAGDLFRSAAKTVCIDHHVSNPGFADINHIVPDASSCAEVLAELFDYEKTDRDIAESLFTGIVHDCGVFQYRNTKPATMRTAAALMEKGIDSTEIIDATFNRRTFVQNRITGYALSRASLHLDGRCVSAVITAEDMERFGAGLKDLDIIVSDLRQTEGVLAAVFLYQTGENEYKISLRSNTGVNVSDVAARFGGGGHILAAGATVEGTPEQILPAILACIEEQL